MNSHFRRHAIAEWGPTTFVIAYTLLILVLLLGGSGHNAYVEASSDRVATPAPAVTTGVAKAEVAAMTLQAAPEAGASETNEAEAAHAQHNHMRLVGQYPLPGSRIEGREIVLYFDAPLAAPDAQRAARDISDWLHFATPLQGFTLHEGNKLIYRIDRHQSLPSRPVQMRIHSDLHSVDGHTIHPEDTTLTISGHSLEILESQVGRKDDGGYVASIRFSRPIAQEGIADNIQCKDAENNSVQQMTLDLDSQLGLLLGLEWPADVAMPVTVRLDAGLSARQGDATLNWPAYITFEEPPTLAVQSVTWRRHAAQDNRINLLVGDRLNRNHLESHVLVFAEDSEEPIPFRSSAVSSGEVLHLEHVPSGTKALRLVLKAGLRDRLGRMLLEDYETVLEPEITPLESHSRRWEESPHDGSLALNLRFNHDIDPTSLQEHLRAEPAVANLEAVGGAYQQVYITGDWQGDTEYRLTIEAGLETIDGLPVLREEMRLALDRTPKVEAAYFDYPGKLYFPKRMAGPMLMRGRNTETATVRLHQLLPNNIVPALNMLQQDRTHDYFNEQFSRRVAEREVAFPPSDEEIREAPLPLDDFMPSDKRGVFALGISPHSDYRNNKLMLWTDIGLLAHWQDDEVVVFAHDLLSLEPLPLAKVTVFSNKNQVLGTVNTDAEGIAHVQAIDTSYGTPRVVVVETDDDYTFLDLQARYEENPDFSGDMPSYDPEAYDAYIYTDRNLYRPGETIHARWLVRSNYGDALADVPLQVRLRGPLGNVLEEETTVLSQWGSAGLDFETQAAYATGSYQIELLTPGSDSYLHAETVNLEDFVPNRIKAAVEADDAPWFAGETYDFTVQANHLFGPPANGLKTEAGFILRQGEYESAQWPDYHFGNDADFTPETTSLGETVTDAEGQAAFQFSYAGSPPLSFPTEVTLRGNVSEVGGRGVTANANRLLLPEPTLLGMRLSPQPGGEGVDVAVAAINTADESPAALDTVTVTLEQEQWHYNLRWFRGHQQPRWDKRYIQVAEAEVSLQDGVGNTAFPLQQRYGDFRVRVHADGKEQYASQVFTLRWNRIDVQDRLQPDLVQVSLDQPAYGFGDTVRLHIESGFDGKAMVLVQGKDFKETLLTDVKDGYGEVRFMVGPEHYPNVWANVTMAHTVEPGAPQVYPYSSFQAINIPLEDPERAIQIAFEDFPEDAVLPKQAIDMTLQASDANGAPVQGEITLAAVDEGIHAILGYENPDPYRWFQRARQPDMRWNHYYDRVAYDFTPAPIGGDVMARRLARDAAPVDENWIRPVALWSGVVETDAEGRAQVTLDLPEFNGELRFVAVAVSQTATGAAAESLTVRRPCVLQTTLPRFVLPGDQFVNQATLYNTTDTPKQVALHWESSGVLEGMAGSRELELAAGAQRYIQVPMTAGNAIGQGGIRWAVEVTDADGTAVDAFTEDMPLPVRAPASFQTDHELKALEPGESYRISNRRFLEDERLETRVSVGAHPVLQLEVGLKYLIGYPYGCLEQTVSRLFPSYLMRQSADLLTLSMSEIEDLDSFVDAGVQRLLSMQTPSGGISTWPGSHRAAPYSSVYALHFLTVLHQDGHPALPEAAYRNLQEYVRGLLFRNVRDWSVPSESYLQAYVIYVLALDGDSEALEAIETFEGMNIPRSARYLLAAAKAINMADPAEARAYLEAQPSQALDIRETDGTLISPIRDTAVELMALQHMEAPLPDQQTLARRLLRHLEITRHPNTQDMAFIVTALAPYLQAISQDMHEAAAAITYPGGEASLDENAHFSHAHDGPGGQYTILNAGSIPLYLNYSIGGVPERVNLNPVSEGIAAQRILRDAQGDVMEWTDATAAFAHGHTYIITLDLKLDESMHHVVIADLLPAGLEIENPRLDADVLTGVELAEAPTPSHLEIRDDRLVLAFDHLDAGAHQFHYAVRAVTPGAFVWPALNAECMYQPELHGRSAALHAVVRAAD